MEKRLGYTTYEEAKKNFQWSERWKLFEGDRKSFNIARECVDRHPGEKTAIRIKFSDRRSECYTFRELQEWTSRFANFLKKIGIGPGDRVAVMLFPCLEFYVTMFGTFKAGAVVVPCFPLFGPDAVAYRLETSGARAIVLDREMFKMLEGQLSGLQVLIAEDLKDQIAGEEAVCALDTTAETLAMIQFSSGTTGAPKQVFYRHGAITVSAPLLEFGIGLREEDEYFCPSSPAWGHGIWYGTIGPLIFGNAIGAFSGKFIPEVFLEGLEEFGVTNMSAIASHYRLLIEVMEARPSSFKPRILTYTGEPMPMELVKKMMDRLGIVPHCLYGTTEAGPITLDYAYDDWVVKPGSLGKPMIGGVRVAVVDEKGAEIPAGQVGQIALWAEDGWKKIGDSAYVDEDGFFWYVGRADDVIISAGYTIGPLEVEGALLKHPAVEECAVIGVPDKDRGQVVKAFLKLNEGFHAAEGLRKEIQEFVRTRLSPHEYPREIEFIEEIPKTADGKIRRTELRQRGR